MSIFPFTRRCTFFSVAPTEALVSRSMGNLNPKNERIIGGHKMGRGTQLNETEIKMILSLKQEGTILSKISKLVGRSRNVIRNSYNNYGKYSKTKGKDHPRAVSDRGVRAIVKVASNSMLTSRQIAPPKLGYLHIYETYNVFYKNQKIFKREKLKENHP